jgi:hypothetical protein
MVVFGKIILHCKDLGALGMVRMGEFVGEEILEKCGSNRKRTESSYSEGDSYLLEW